jgi:hypothetical protein
MECISQKVVVQSLSNRGNHPSKSIVTYAIQSDAAIVSQFLATYLIDKFQVSFIPNIRNELLDKFPCDCCELCLSFKILIRT